MSADMVAVSAESWTAEPRAFIELARVDAFLLGQESSAAVLIDALRLCALGDLDRIRMVARSLDSSLGQSSIPGLANRQTDAEAAPLEAARAREGSFAIVLSRLRPEGDAAERKLAALMVRHKRLRAAARIASRDWAACSRDGGRLWLPGNGERLLVRVLCPGVLEVTAAESARLIARSLPGRLYEVDPAHDPE